MNFCKDCKHYDPNTEMCTRVESRTNPVTGEKEYSYAKSHRGGKSSDIFCGREGKYFEALEE